MQFLPRTWVVYGVDADNDGSADPYRENDAVFGAANYLHQLGAPRHWRAAVFGYNHSWTYVEQVLGCS
jgi:membrane-bound lytic murein transglycosylase B